MKVRPAVSSARKPDTVCSTVPGIRTLQEVHEYVSQRLHVVPSRLLDAQVRVDRGVSGGPGEVLVLPVRNVLMRAIVTKLFCQSKIDGVDKVALLAEPH